MLDKIHYRCGHISVCKHHSLHVEVRGQLVAVSVPISLCGFWDWTKVIRLDAFTNWTILLACFKRYLGCFSVPVLVIFCLSVHLLCPYEVGPKYLSVDCCRPMTISHGLRKGKSRFFSLSLPFFPSLPSLLSLSLCLLSSFPLKCVFWSSAISWVCHCLLIVWLGRISPCGPDWPQMPPASTLWRGFCSCSFPSVMYIYVYKMCLCDVCMPCSDMEVRR